MVIIDDFLADVAYGSINIKRKLSELFFRGRHSNSNIIFFAQTFFKIPVEIRDNSEQFCLFKSSKGRVRINQIANALVGEIPRDVFVEAYDAVTNKITGHKEDGAPLYHDIIYKPCTASSI